MFFTMQSISGIANGITNICCRLMSLFVIGLTSNMKVRTFKNGKKKFGIIQISNPFEERVEQSILSFKNCQQVCACSDDGTKVPKQFF